MSSPMAPTARTPVRASIASKPRAPLTPPFVPAVATSAVSLASHPRGAGAGGSREVSTGGRGAFEPIRSARGPAPLDLLEDLLGVLSFVRDPVDHARPERTLADFGGHRVPRVEPKRRCLRQDRTEPR